MKKAVQTDQAPSAPAILSQAVNSNGFIFVAGQIHNTSAGEMVTGSVTERLDQIMANITAILDAAGSSLEDVVKVTIYVTDMAQMPELNQVYPSYFKLPYPAREALCVKDLPLGASIEISIVAAAR